ncbi:MAG TPA: NAD(P)-dependent oxidoreductase [Pseudomonadales bacterium]|nr:NAD(P)-dependent oxidoreductase [Pseudomonadales bacterium]
MQVLVTGSSSEPGQLICETLLERGDRVVAFDLRPTGIHHANLVSVVGDVRDGDALNRAAEGCDTGIHLAVMAGESPAIELISVNVLGAYTFFEAARRHGFSMSVLTSSAPGHLSPGSHDNAILNTSGENDLYDLTKTVQEVIAQDFHLHGLPTICLRLGHIVRGADGVNADEPIPLHALDYCRGGWVAIEDVVPACIAALSVVPETEFKLYNLVGSRSGRARYRTADAERRLGMKLQYDFAEFE